MRLFSFTFERPTEKELKHLSVSTLFHSTNSEAASDIMSDMDDDGHGTANIIAMSGKGSEIKSRHGMLRDLLIVDPARFEKGSTSCYAFFFVGKPGAFRKFLNVQGRDKEAIIAIQGRDLLNGVGHLFYRPVDKALAIRGDYLGPATVRPWPLAQS